MKLHEEFKLFETMWDEPGTKDTVTFLASSMDERIIIAKKDLALAKKLDRKACDIWESAEGYGYDEDEICAKLGISAFSGVEIFDKLAAEAGLKWDLADYESLDKKGSFNDLREWQAATNSPNRPKQNLTWEELLNKADELLAELSVVSNNEDYDDGDGYWEEEYTVWCNRYLYYSDTLNNSNKLEKLCDDYSKKLPNVEFYYVEDEDICEIGYLATREE